LFLKQKRQKQKRQKQSLQKKTRRNSNSNKNKQNKKSSKKTGGSPTAKNIRRGCYYVKKLKKDTGTVKWVETDSESRPLKDISVNDLMTIPEGITDINLCDIPTISV
jgi:hypothetical protein